MKSLLQVSIYFRRDIAPNAIDFTPFTDIDNAIKTVKKIKSIIPNRKYTIAGEQLIGGTNLGAKQKSIIDRCTARVNRSYQQNDYQGHIPTLQDFRAALLQQDEPEAKELALAIELFTHGSLNTFAKQTNVDTDKMLHVV